MAKKNPRRSVKQRTWTTYVEGAKELAGMFGDMVDVAIKILDDAAKAAADLVLADARRRVPIDTGALRDSLEIKTEKRRKNTKITYQIRSKGVSQGGVRYAFAVENGVKGQKAQPFLRPAIDENRTKIRQVINQSIVDALRGL